MISEIAHNIVIVPAAISDYSPKKQKGKIPSQKDELTIKLFPNPKIIREIKKRTDCYLVGFKAEFDVTSEELVFRAKNRMKEMGLDLIVANDITQTTRDENHVFIIGNDMKNEEISGTKEEIAQRIFDRVVNL